MEIQPAVWASSEGVLERGKAGRIEEISFGKRGWSRWKDKSTKETLLARGR